MPRPFNDPNIPVSSDNMLMFDDINTYDTTAFTDPQILASETVRFIETEKPFRRYMKNRPLARQAAATWQNTKDYVQGTLVADWPTATTSFKFGLNTATPAGTTLGYFKYTYYVTFRGQNA